MTFKFIKFILSFGENMNGIDSRAKAPETITSIER